MSDQRGFIQTSQVIAYGAVALIAVVGAIGGLSLYDSTANVDDNVFAERVAAANAVVDLAGACQYSSTVRTAAIGGASTTWTQPGSVARTQSGDTRPLATSFTMKSQGMGANGVSLGVSATGVAATGAVVPCKTDGVLPGSTITAP